MSDASAAPDRAGRQSVFAGNAIEQLYEDNI